MGLPAFIAVAAKHAAQQASKWDLVDGMMPSAVASAAVLLVCSCWKGTPGDSVGRRPQKGSGSRKQQAGAGRNRNGKREREAAAEVEGGGEREEDGLDVGPAAVSAAGGASVQAMKRPFRAMYEQRGRLFTVEFLERRAAKGVTLETLQPALVC